MWKRRISPITMLPPSGSALTSTISSSLDSMLTRDSLTRGGFTRSLGTGVSPDFSNSSTSGGNSAEQMFIRSAISSDTTFTTNSPVASMLRIVSFLAPSLSRTMGQNSIVGGLALTPVKKLKGARLRIPSTFTVETNAMGRGTMTPIISL